MRLVMNTIQHMTNLFKEAHYSLFEVGGHLRDELLGRESHDIDMATDALPDVTMRILNSAGFTRIYTVGIEYGTIGVHVGDQTIEITTFRGEVYPTASRKPQVTFGKLLLEDLSRRDFTINAMARDALTGEVFDPFGGRDDLKRRVIRCVGCDDCRFGEDPLRMLRAVRFACQLGFELKVVIEHPEDLVRISAERIHDELSKILLSPAPTRGIDMLVNTGLMEFIIPEMYGLIELSQGRNHIKDAYEHTLNVLNRGAAREHGDDQLVFRMACLLHDIGKQHTFTQVGNDVHFYDHQTIGAIMTRDILRRLTYTNDEIERVSKLVECHMMPLQMRKIDITKRVIRRYIRNVGSVNLNMLFDLNVCDVRSTKNDRVDFLNYLRTVVDEVLLEQPEVMCSPINGNEIMASLHLGPGKTVGLVKDHLTNLVIDGTLAPDDKLGAITFAESFLSGKSIPDGEV